MNRWHVVSLGVFVGAALACSSELPAEQIAASVSDLSAAAGQPAASAARVRTCSRYRPCPRGEVCDIPSGHRTGRCHKAPQDDPATPGDDRAGWVACAGDDSCGPGTRCCFGQQTCSTAEYCAAPIDLGWTCDGPEDCASGERCFSGRNGHKCHAGINMTSEYVMCHSDADCVGAICQGSGTPCPVCVPDATGSASCLAGP